MQGGVIGGICLLACLLSLSFAEDVGDPKQLEESEATDQKEAQSSADEIIQGSNSQIASDDLKSDVNGSKPTSLEETKSNSEKQNISQTVGDSPSSMESSNNRSSQDFLAFPGIGSAQSRKSMSESAPADLRSASYLSRITSGQGLTADSVHFNGAASSSYNNSVPGITRGATGNSTLFPLFASNSQDYKGNQKSNETIRSENNSTLAEKLQELTPLKPLERVEENKKTAISYKSGIPIGVNEIPEVETNFKPFFSPGYVQKPASNYIDPSQPLIINEAIPYTSNFNQYPPIPKYNYDSKATFGQTPLELPSKDDIQMRNADGSQYSETINSYPFVSVSSKSDSSSSESGELRSGAPYVPSSPSNQNKDTSVQAYAQVLSSNDALTAHNQGLNPYSYGYPPGSADGQTPSNGAASGQSSGTVIQDGKSRVIMPHEYIFPHKIRGGENVIQCTRENELHHFWAPGFDCLVCICLNEYGLLEPVCASCSGCQNPAPPEPPPHVPDQSRPTPEPYAPVPIPDPYVPLPLPNLEPFTPSASAPSLILEPAVERDLELTTPAREVPVSCTPLPSGRPFPHPLSPCQLCICKEAINAFGKIEVRIDCQDSPQCVVPPELSTLPPIPDIPVPVPLPLCEKFPSHVSFPHPKEKCRLCKCSVELSASGVPEQQITCFGDGDCGPGPKTEPTPLGVTPPSPPIPIPVEPYPGPFPEPVVEPAPEHFPPVPPPNAVTVTPGEPLPWPPISTSPAPPSPIPPRKVPGPLPGPSPHESCRPYPPNQPFQHPWDDCQVCECTESKAVGMVTVEISCYTKLSCCIESPEQVISAIAGKSNSEASSGSNAEENQIKGGSETSTIKPLGYGAFNPVRQNKAYAEANAIVQNALNDPAYQLPYSSASAISNAVSGSQNQGYSEANAIAQSSLNGPYPGTVPYQTVNAYGSAISSGGQSSAEASAGSIPGTNTIPGSFAPYNPGMTQNQAYAEANAIAQKSLVNPTNQPPAPYQPMKPLPSVPAVGLTSAEASEEFTPVTNKPSSAYPLYNPGSPQNQAYVDAQYSRPVSSTYKPSALYAQYNPEISPNQVYAEAAAQYNELNSITITQKPPALYGQYNTGISGASGQYSVVTSTFKPPSLYQYNPETLQNPNQAYGQANAQYNAVTSTQRPIALFNPYSTGGSQSQAYQTPNAVYKGVPQTQAYAGANAQNNLASPGYYLSGPYPGKSLGTASALGTVNGGDSSAVAEAIAQSQDYTPYIQPGPQLGSSSIPNPAPGYTYPANYYAGYINPQFASYPGRPDGLEGYKQSPVKYAGNFDFNGQVDGINGLGPQASYYPYGGGYAQGLAGSNMYSSLYPKQASYEINPLYRPGQYAGSNAQTSAQAYTNLKMQTKSGEGYEEDSDDSK